VSFKSVPVGTAGELIIFGGVHYLQVHITPTLETVRSQDSHPAVSLPGPMERQVQWRTAQYSQVLGALTKTPGEGLHLPQY
jgi:hypothetical protein